MKTKKIILLVMFLVINITGIIKTQEKQKSLTMEDIMNLQQYHIDGAITAKYTEVTVDEVRKLIADSVELAARQFGYVGKTLNCGALDNLGEYYGNKDKKLNFEEVMTLKKVDVYRAVLLNFNKSMSADYLMKIEDEEVIILGIRTLGIQLSKIIGYDDPCGINSIQTNVPLGQSPHLGINNTCPVFKLLLEELENENVNVKLEAINAISKLYRKSIIEPLITIIPDENNEVRLKALEILKSLTEEDYGMDDKAWLNWWKNTSK